MEASVLWKLHLKELVKFSETRFANSRRQVYINLHHDLPAIVTCLEEKILLSCQNPADGKLKEKANEAKQCLGKLLNVRFLLTLAGCADVYGQYGKIVNVAQMVNVLPHERFDLFMKEVSVLDKMAKCLTSHKNCGTLVEENAKVKCLLPLLHADKESLQNKGEIRNIPVIEENPVVAAGLSSRTRNMQRQASISQRLEESTMQYSIEQLRATDPKDIVKLFLDPENGLFNEIEMIMQAISVCCIKVSCESVLESLVSIFENHYDVRRNMNEKSTSEEFMIAINGPNLSHADAVIKEAMNSYWNSRQSGQGTWHFFRTTALEQLKDHTGGSRVLQRMLNKPSKLPFMDI